MLLKLDHSWDLSPKEARGLQDDLVGRLVLCDDFRRPPLLVAGVDVSYDKKSNLSYAGVVVFKYPQLEVVERKFAVRDTTFPYVPGLLTFREGPSLISAFARIEREPDLIIFDGQGQAHPRGFGIAAHMGLLLDKPSIGCAKKKLCGTYKEPGDRVGSKSPIEYRGRTIGMVVRTRERVKPVFVSPGHRVGMDSAVESVLSACRGYRLPEVTRQAHAYVNQLRRGGPAAVVSYR